MRQSHNWRKPRALALGGACLVGLGVQGCARETGLDLAKQDARTDSAITERANEAILRSKQELAGVQTGKGAAAGSVAATEAGGDERPALASRWRTPFKGAGNLLRRKPEEPAEDPFLAHSEDAVAPAGGSSIAALADEQSPAAASSAAARTVSTDRLATERKVAMAETPPAAARSKPVMSNDSRAALDEFLKSQEPVTVDDRALADAYQSSDLMHKPGTTRLPKKSASQTFSDEAIAASAPATEELEHRTLGGRSVAASSQARPFPAEAYEAETPAARPVSKLRQSSVAAAPVRKNPLAADAPSRGNPLVDRAEPVAEAPATRSATGREIATLLKKARQAGEQGQHEQAMSYAVAASDLAEQCSYEFRSTEQSPAQVFDWLADKKAEAEQLARGREDRRELLAARRQERGPAVAPTSFSNPLAEEPAQPASAAMNPFESEPQTPASRTLAVGGSSFQSWAEGVGRDSSPRERTPDWPVLSRVELAASDDLWQPSRLEPEQGWTDATRSGSSVAAAETRLASALSDAPAFVATADGRSAAGTRVIRPASPMVQLGQPIDLTTDIADDRLAGTQGAYGQRRGPRLASPPPLSIDDSEHRSTAVSSRQRGRNRVVWYAMIGGMAFLGLVLFRRWAYRTTTEASS